MRAPLRLVLVFAAAWPLAVARSQSVTPAGRPAAAPMSLTSDDLLDVVTVTAGPQTKDGRWLAVMQRTAREGASRNSARDNDPSYTVPQRNEITVVDTRTGAVVKPLAAGMTGTAVSWSPDGTRLLILVSRDSLIDPIVWDLATKKTMPVRIPATHYVSAAVGSGWSQDGSEVVLDLRTWEFRRKAQKQFQELIQGPVVVMSSKKPYLGWEELRRVGNTRSVAAVNVGTGTLRELVPESQFTVALSGNGTWVTLSEDTVSKTPYDRFKRPMGQIQPPVRKRAVPLAASGPERDRAAQRAKLEIDKDVTFTWAEDGNCYAYAKDGRVFLGTVGAEEKQIAGPPAGVKSDTGKSVPDSIKQREAKEKFALVRANPALSWLLISNPDGIWGIDPASGQKTLIVKTDSAPGATTYQVADVTENGTAFFTGTKRGDWTRGIYRYSRATGRLETVREGAAAVSGLKVSSDGSSLVVSMTDGSRPGDLYTLSGDGSNLRRITTTNTKFDDPRTRRAELLSYLDTDGRRQYGVLYYPWDYEPGKRYPAVFHMYEKFDAESFEQNDKLLNANGYFVMRPSVPTRTDPGYEQENWIKGASAAANKLIEMGIVDSARLGVYGTSYGGLATYTLVTQTNRFKAAIPISGLTDIISLYTDSPRMVLRNMGFAESKTEQLNIGATLWEQPQKYIQFSAIMFADRIKTPMLIVTGEQDHNVPYTQGQEMFYALRRLGREVEWVNYTNGGHAPWSGSAADFKDFQRRFIEWWDQHLKPESKPKT